MKLKLCILSLVGLVAGSLAVHAQDNTPPTDPPPAADSAVENNQTAQPVQTAPAETTAATATVAAADTVAQAATDSAAQTPAAGDSSAQNNAPAQPGAVIPLIVMDDVPLTDAIKNLARQAGLNYILDPKVAFGQPGPDGRPIPQPSVSIRWENVTAAQALSALLGTYNLQLVEDPKSKIAKVTVKDPAAPDPLITKVIQLKYASPTNIVVAVQNALTDKRSKVVPDVRTSQLVVLATEKELSDLEPMIASLDTPTKQVLIEAKLLETSISPKTQKGMDWTGTLQGQHLAFGNNLQNSPVPQDSVNRPLATDWPKMLFDTAGGFNPGTAFLNADGVNAVFSFLNTYAEAKVISSPRTVTLDNEPARIEVVRASPIIQITPGSVQTAGGSSITYTNLGVILHVTPRISANNLINLKVIPEVSRIFDTVKRQVSVGNGQGNYEADEYDIRKIETTVLIPSGNTLVLGGLVQDDIRTGNVKVPVLGDIPVLGYLFRSDSKSRQKSNLLVFLTPTIVEDSDFQPTKTKFLHTPAPHSDTLEGDWSSWDSGKPRDWSQPDPPVDASEDSPQFSKLPDAGN